MTSPFRSPKRQRWHHPPDRPAWNPISKWKSSKVFGHGEASLCISPLVSWIGHRRISRQVRANTLEYGLLAKQLHPLFFPSAHSVIWLAVPPSASPSIPPSVLLPVRPSVRSSLRKFLHPSASTSVGFSGRFVTCELIPRFHISPRISKRGSAGSSVHPTVMFSWKPVKTFFIIWSLEEANQSISYFSE